MRRLLCSALALAAVWSQAAEIRFTLHDFTGDGVTNARVYLTPQSTPMINTNSGAAIVNERKPFRSDSDGLLNVSNVVRGIYQVTVEGRWRATEFFISVPDTNGVLNATDLICAATNAVPEGSYAWPIAKSYSRTQVDAAIRADFASLGSNTLTASKLVDRYNVTYWGAKGDGTQDDTFAIQAAIDSVTNSGGTVILPLGTYKITAPLYVHRGVVVKGSGSYSTIIRPYFSNAPAAIFADGYNWGIQGLAVDFVPSAYRNLTDCIRVGDNASSGSFFVDDFTAYHCKAGLRMNKTNSWCGSITKFRAYSSVIGASLGSGTDLQFSSISGDPSAYGAANWPYVTNSVWRESVGVDLTESYNCVVRGGQVDCMNAAITASSGGMHSVLGGWSEYNNFDLLGTNVFFEYTMYSLSGNVKVKDSIIKSGAPSVGVAASYPTDLRRGMISCYPFACASLGIVDTVSGSVTALPANAYWTNGPIESAVARTTASGGFTLPCNQWGSNSWTVFLMWKPDWTEGVSEVPFLLRATNGSEFKISFGNHGRYHAISCYNGTNIVSASKYSAELAQRYWATNDVWVPVAASWDSASGVMTLIDPFQGTAALTVTNPNWAGPLTLLALYGAGYEAQIGHLVIWNRVLTLGEVNQYVWRVKNGISHGHEPLFGLNNGLTNASGQTISQEIAQATSNLNAATVTNTGAASLSAGTLVINGGSNVFNGAVAFGTDGAHSIGTASGNRPKSIYTTSVATFGGDVTTPGITLYQSGVMSGMKIAGVNSGNSMRVTDIATQTKDRVFINGGEKGLADNFATAILNIASHTNSWVGGVIDWSVCATDGTERQVVSGSTHYSAVNTNGVWSSMVATNTAALNAVSATSGTLTTAWKMETPSSGGSTNVIIRVNADTSLTPSAGGLYIKWQLRNQGTNSITVF